MSFFFKSTLLFAISSLITCHTFGQSSHSLIWDQLLSPKSSSENFLSLQKLIYTNQDIYLPPKFAPENKFIGKLTGIAYRVSKTVLLDYQLDFVIHALQHEAFGHGFRYREFELKSNAFHISLFPPLGNAKAFAVRGSANYQRLFGAHENIMTAIGGMEAALILSDRIRMNWLYQEKIHYREGLLFLSSFNDANFYIWTTHFLNRNTGDVASYLKRINTFYGFPDAIDYRLNSNQISKFSFLNLADPLHLFAIYTFVVKYLGNGDTYFEYPWINFRQARYLPSFMFRLSPFGIEVVFSNYLKIKNKIANLEFRIGDRTYSKSFGINLQYQYFSFSDKAQLGVAAYLWTQPALELGGTSPYKTNKGLGGAIILDTFLNPFTSNSINFFMQIGYKTTGYLPGEILKDTFILRFGLSLKKRTAPT
jgi:hypothetical protein